MSRISEFEQLNKKEIYNDKKIMHWTIYGRNLSPKALYDKFYRIHDTWKPYFVKPFIWLSTKIFGKYLVKEIPDEKYNRNFKIFDKAYDQALIKWRVYYQGHKLEEAKKKLRIDNKMNNVRYIAYTLLLNDTAYREFFNMLMFEITKEMNKSYEGEDIKHLIYKSKSVIDVGYYIAYGEMNKDKEVYIDIQKTNIPEVDNYGR